MTINKLNGTECGTEIAKKINDIIDEKASVSLDNLDTDGQAILDGKVNSSDLFDANEHIKINKLQSYSLPSNSHVDLTLGSSGTIYTAPADGWVYISKTATAGGQYLLLANTNKNGLFMVGYEVRSWANANIMRVSIPVTKGSKFRIQYDVGGKTTAFQFVYAVGSEPQT